MKANRGLIWAIIGGAVLLLAVIGIVIGSLASQSEDETTPTADPSTSSGPSTDPTTSPSIPTASSEVVDAGAVDRGWIPEPVTSDPEEYLRAAIAAAGTFDTQLATREEFLEYMKTWYTPDLGFGSEADQLRVMEGYQTELGQSVVIPDDQWNSLAAEDGRMSAVVDAIELESPSINPNGDLTMGTAEVTITFTQVDGSGTEYTYDEDARIRAHVLCGENIVPTPNSPQQKGDCKLIRIVGGQVGD